MFLLPIAAIVLDTVPLSSLDLRQMRQGWGEPQANLSVDKHPLSIGGETFPSGVGTHAASVFYVDLGGRGKRFSALVGVDDETKGHHGSVEFRVLLDGRMLWKSGVMRTGDSAKKVDVDLRGGKTLLLMVGSAGDGIDYDHADWADATIDMASGILRAISPPTEAAVILTPKPPKEPRITGAKVFGARPGKPFLFTATASGARPMRFLAMHVPSGVTFDSATGRFTGTTPKTGTYNISITASNKYGKATRTLRVVSGDTIALTPPLGWNSWNCFAGDVDQDKVLSAAKAMVSSGLAQHGWTYINIDDCWSVKPGDKERGGTPRDEQNWIQTNAKFPNMKELCMEIHNLGLKAGIYSSPGPTTCAGFTATYGYEQQDAQRWAQWGFDYLKYDWCSYGSIARNPPDLLDLQAPYKEMRRALNGANRDIVFSFCQYGMGDVWKWGEEVGGNCWRTTGDITDSWESMSGIGFSQNGHEKYAGPGHWNDPDMLVVGWVGWGPQLHPTRLTPNEQYTHISLWCLLSSPLLIGCDLTRLDDFTKSLLTNDEVLAVNQDPLGKPAKRISIGEDGQVWGRVLEDGSMAVGLFNLSESEAKISVAWRELGLKGKHTVRDLWRQKNVGSFAGGYSAMVPRHGVVLIKVSKS